MLLRIVCEGEGSLYFSVGLLEDTKGIVRLSRGSVVVWAAFFFVIIAFVYVLCVTPEFSSALRPVIGGGQSSGVYSFKTFPSAPSVSPTLSPSPTPTVCPSTVDSGECSPQSTLTVVPEFNLGGSLFALLTCFVAFTIFLRYKNNAKTQGT